MGLESDLPQDAEGEEAVLASARKHGVPIGARRPARPAGRLRVRENQRGREVALLDLDGKTGNLLGEKRVRLEDLLDVDLARRSASSNAPRKTISRQKRP
jgi:hypothetical protein